MADPQRIVRVDTESDLVAALNKIVDRDLGLYGDYVINRYNGSSYSYDIDNPTGNHLSLGGTVALFQDTGIAFGVDLSVDNSLNVGTGVSGAGAGEIYVGADNTHRGIFVATSSATAIGSRDNFPLQFRINNATKVELDTSGHLSPAANATQDLGLTGTRWRDIYSGRDLYASNAANIGSGVSGAGAGEIYVGADNTHRGIFVATSAATAIGSRDNFPLQFRINNATSIAIDTSGHMAPSGGSTQDLGASATRWRDIYMGRQLLSNVATGTAPFVIASTTLVTNLNADLLDGANTATTSTANAIPIALGTGKLDASWLPSSLSAGVTLAGHLLFSPDNTYDIGAAGATRPRTIYVATSIINSGTLQNTGTAYINDTSNANVTLGLTINQGGADDNILDLKSSDVAHGMTSLVETDTYWANGKISATAGGLYTRAYSGGTTAWLFEGNHTTDDTAKSTAAAAQFEFRAWTKSGTSSAAPGANANLLVVRSGSNTRFIVDQEGDIHADSGSGTANTGTGYLTYDGYEDAELVRALDVERRAPGLVTTEFDRFLRYNRADLEAARIATFNDDGVFVNYSALVRLHSGAVWQLACKINQIQQSLLSLGIQPEMLGLTGTP